MKRLLLALIIGFFTLLSSNEVKASHVAGGDFAIECLGNDSFLVTFNFFRDCDGISAPSSLGLDFNSPCGNVSVTASQDSSIEVSQLCPSAITQSTCNNGGLPGIEQYYYSAIVVLPPCAAGNWVVDVSISARNPNNNLSSSGSFYLESEINTDVTPCNNLPQFSAQPIPYVCAGQQVVYNFGVTEVDGDSLDFRFDDPLIGAGNPAGFSGGFSATNPFPVPVTLDPQTGQLTFTPTSAMIQGGPSDFWVLKVCVDEYRNGVLVGTVCRDVQLTVQNCDNYQPYMINPGIQNFTGSGSQVDSNSVVACLGQTFSFDVQFSDSLHPNQSFGDSVTLTTNAGAVLSGVTTTITNGDTATINISGTIPANAPPFSIFTINAVDDACNVAGIASVQFDVTAIPNTYAGPDQILCQGVDTADIEVVGGDTFTWSVISGDPINLGVNFKDTTGTNGKNVWAFPNTTTTYQVVSNLATGCGNTDTITIVSAPNFNLSAVGDTAVCPADSFYNFPLDASTDSNFVYSYQWSNGSFLDNDTIQTPTATITETQTFGVTVESDSGCIKEDDLTVTFTPPFPVDATVDFADSVLCNGDSTAAFIDFGAQINNNCGPATTPCPGNVNQGIIGTGTNAIGGTTYPAPYGNWYWGARHQMLYTAAELQTMTGTAPGAGAKLTSFGLDVAQLGSQTNYQNFEIYITCTGSNDLNSGWATGLTQVYNSAGETIFTGWNDYTFSQAYDWDGTSNLVVQVCFNNSSFTGNGNAYTNTTATPFTSVRYSRADQSGVCANNGLFQSTSSNRPNGRFGYCTGFDPAAFNYQWSPNVAISNTGIYSPDVYPGATTTYEVIYNDTFGACVDTISGTIDVVNSYNPSFDLDSAYCVTEDPDTALPFTPGGVWTGDGITDSLAGEFSPGVAGGGTAFVTYTLASPAGNCVTDTTYEISVIPLPDATLTSPDSLCYTGGPYTLQAATPGGVWSGPAIVDSLTGEIDPNEVQPGQTFIEYEIFEPCYVNEVTSVFLYEAYEFNFVDTPKTVCINDTLILNNYNRVTAGNAGPGPIEYTWSGPGITNTDSGFFDPSTLSPGRFTLSLTAADPNGACATTDSMAVVIYPVDTPKVVNNLIYCDNTDKGNININTGFGQGNWTINPIPPTTATLLPNQTTGRFNPQQIGPGMWYLEYTYQNINGCIGELNDTIVIQNTPDKPVFDDTTYCVGDFITVSGEYDNPDSVLWYSDAPISSSNFIGSGMPFDYGDALDPTNVNEVTIYARETNGECKSGLASYTLPISETPNSNFYRTYVDSNNVEQVADTFDFIKGRSPFSITYDPVAPLDQYDFEWDLWLGCDPSQSADGQYGCPIVNTEDPVVSFTYEKEGLYRARLVVTNDFGCSDTSFSNHEVLFSGEIPNVFTPNGDGVNDEFFIPGAGALRDFRVEIYNRWGRKVYEWTDPQAGWDGEGHNDGVYFYVVTAKRGNGEDYIEKGNVTLVGNGN
jgi:gliding motility-associated-like protein